MVETIDEVALNELPLAPVNPMPYRVQVRAIRAFHTGLGGWCRTGLVG